MEHKNLRYMLHKMGRVKLPSYRKCSAEKETLVHILCEYLVLERVRSKTVDRARRNEADGRVALAEEAGMLRGPPGINVGLRNLDRKQDRIRVQEYKKKNL